MLSISVGERWLCLVKGRKKKKKLKKNFTRSLERANCQSVIAVNIDVNLQKEFSNILPESKYVKQKKLQQINISIVIPLLQVVPNN